MKRSANVAVYTDGDSEPVVVSVTNWSEGRPVVGGLPLQGQPGYDWVEIVGDETPVDCSVLNATDWDAVYRWPNGKCERIPVAGWSVQRDRVIPVDATGISLLAVRDPRVECALELREVG